VLPKGLHPFIVDYDNVEATLSAGILGMVANMTTNEQAQYVYECWDQFARSGRLDELVALYAPDGAFESPLVPVLLQRDSGICQGHEEMRRFFEEGFRRRPNELVRWWRNGRYHFDGSTLIWEYPGRSPEGDQLDLMEVMELRDGLIAHHKVYWGFRGVNELLRSQRQKLVPNDSARGSRASA